MLDTLKQKLQKLKDHYKYKNIGKLTINSSRLWKRNIIVNHAFSLFIYNLKVKNNFLFFHFINLFDYNIFEKNIDIHEFEDIADMCLNTVLKIYYKKSLILKPKINIQNLIKFELDFINFMGLKTNIFLEDILNDLLSLLKVNEKFIKLFKFLNCCIVYDKRYYYLNKYILFYSILKYVNKYFYEFKIKKIIENSRINKIKMSKYLKLIDKSLKKEIYYRRSQISIYYKDS